MEHTNYMDIRDGVLVSYTGQAQTLCIPEGVRIIGAYAFCGGLDGTRKRHNNKYTQEIYLPSTVEEIDNAGFLSCMRLKQVSISEGGLRTIGRVHLKDVVV